MVADGNLQHCHCCAHSCHVRRFWDWGCEKSNYHGYDNQAEAAASEPEEDECAPAQFVHEPRTYTYVNR